MKKKNKRDYLMMLVSFIIAIGLWGIAMNEENPDVTSYRPNVPVELVETGYGPSNVGLEVLEGQDQTVRVALTGKWRYLSGGYKGPLEAKVDLTGITEAGTYELPVEVDLGETTTIKARTEPATVSVTLDWMETVTLPVKVEVVGTSQQNLVLSQISASPGTISVTGPKSQLENLSHLSVVVDVSSVSDDAVLTLPVSLINKSGEIVENPHITLEQTNVRVTIPVHKSKSVTVQAPTTGSLPEGYWLKEIKVAPSSVLIVGSEEVLAGIDSIECVAVDLSNIRQDTTVERALRLPDGVQCLSEDTICDVTVVVEAGEEKTLEVKNLETIGVPDGYTAQVTTQALQIQLYGPPSQLDEISAEDVRAQVDLSYVDVEQLTGEPLTVPVKLTLQNQQDVKIQGSYTVEVTLTPEEPEQQE
ncbi:MAG: YbbR-like domain-containing protein [Eubacteriales bacterium]|jgi:YbbR domain-containing protein